MNNGIEEPMVFAWMPAISIYFNDPDGHSLEFISILDGESKPENGILTYEKWLEIEQKLLDFQKIEIKDKYFPLDFG